MKKSFHTITILAMFLFGCGPSHFLLYKSSSATIPPNAVIGVVVQTDLASSSNNSCATLMTAALVRKGFVVKTTSPSELLPSELINELKTRPEQRQSFINNILSSVGGDGKFKGDKNVWTELLSLNDIKDSKQRYIDITSFENQLLKDWGVDYILQIIPSGGADFEFTVRVVRVKDRAIIFTLYFSADTHTVANINITKDITATEDATNTRTYHLIQVFEEIATHLNPNL